MAYLIDPYSAKDLSLMFYSAPHDMDQQCHICKPIKSCKDIIRLCPDMKKFCCDQFACRNILSHYDGKIPKFMHKIPVGTKSWNFVISTHSDDVPDIVPIFHKSEGFDMILEKTSIGLEEKRIERIQLENALKRNVMETQTLMSVKNHIIYGTPLER